MFKPADLFDLSQTEHAALFDGCHYAWEALKKIESYLAANLKPALHNKCQGDAFIAISTSGRSRNVLAALSAAREMGITAIGFTGSAGGDMHAACDLLLAAPAEDTALIQQIHIVAAHAICGMVEQALFASGGRGP